jgi:hypothetical protein
MGGKLNIYNLGQKGNNVVKSPIHLEDGEFRKSQNLFVDPNAGDGGVRKRNGYNKLNAAAAGGGASVQGLINLPYPPAKTTTVYAGVQRLTADKNTPTALWRKTADAGTNWADDTAAPTRSTFNPNITSDFYCNAICVFRDKLYYAGDDYVFGTDAPTIHVWDGEVDNIISYIPTSGATGVPCLGVTSMCIHRGQLMIAVLDAGGVGSCNGRVFSLEVATGQLTQIGPAVAAGSYEFGAQVPFTLCSYQNKLWLGSAAANFGSGKIYVIRPGIDGAWAVDTTFASNGVCSLAVYKGKLYAALSAGGLVVPNLVKVRSTLGVWSTSYSSATNAATGISYVTSLIVYDGNLFCIEFNDGRAAGDKVSVNKFNGTAWSEVYKLSDYGPGGRTQHQIGGAIQTGGVLYFVIAEWQLTGETVNVLSDGIVLQSTNGTLFTETTQRSNLSGHIGYIRV